MGYNSAMRGEGTRRSFDVIEVTLLRRVLESEIHLCCGRLAEQPRREGDGADRRPSLGGSLPEVSYRRNSRLSDLIFTLCTLETTFRREIVQTVKEEGQETG